MGHHVWELTGRPRFSGDGIMDYFSEDDANPGIWNTEPISPNRFQFHERHEKRMCKQVEKLDATGTDPTIVSWGERWEPIPNHSYWNTKRSSGNSPNWHPLAVAAIVAATFLCIALCTACY